MDRKAVLLRLEGDTHEAARKAAAEAGLSVNEWICQAVETALGESSPRPADVMQVLGDLADVLAKLRAGFVLVPGAEVPADGWTQIMRPDSR